MTTMPSVDGVLVQWGERLFYPGNRIVKANPTPRLATLLRRKAAVIRKRIQALAVRRAPAVLEPLIPIFVLHDRARRRDVETARDLGATDVLTVPISPRTISTKLRAALKSPRPFVLAAGFFGPDRRARGRTVFAGKERRTRVPRRARVNLTLE